MIKELKSCPFCGSDAKFMKDSKTHCNCSNKDCILSGDKYFHFDKWNTRPSESVQSEKQPKYSYKIGGKYFY